MAATPLPPAFEGAAVADPAQGQVVQLAAKVLRQGRGILVAIARVGRQALTDDVRQADADTRRPAECGGLAWLVRLGTAGGQGVAEQEAECKDVRPPVHGAGYGLTFGDRLHGRLLLGRHPARRPPEAIGDELAGPERSAGEMEVEQHRLAVGGDQDVRRLEVHVDQAASVGIMQRIGQAGGDPDDRLDVRGLLQAPAKRPVGRR